MILWSYPQGKRISNYKCCFQPLFIFKPQNVLCHDQFRAYKFERYTKIAIIQIVKVPRASFGSFLLHISPGLGSLLSELQTTAGTAIYYILAIQPDAQRRLSHSFDRIFFFFLRPTSAETCSFSDVVDNQLFFSMALSSFSMFVLLTLINSYEE